MGSTFFGLVLLALVPFVFIASTSFIKLSFVFSILRNALGIGQVPSGMVITTLAAILTLYVMAPVGVQMAEASAASTARVDLQDPLRGQSAQAVMAAVTSGKEPLRKFLKRNAGARELQLFLRLAQRTGAQKRRQAVVADNMLIVVSAFVITELKEAFQIGFLIFIPFLVIDMVLANVLLALGMHMLAPTTVSLPFKLLLFVLVDGWYVLTEALVLGYR